MLAWDPVQQKEAFRIPYPHAGNGGTMVTAGNLLVQGTINKTFAIYRADNGQKLWEMPVGTVPVSGPITYEVNGKQYIAVNAGWNSAIVSKLTNPDGTPFTYAPGRLMVFALDAKGVTLPPAPPVQRRPRRRRARCPTAAAVARGEALYAAELRDLPRRQRRRRGQGPAPPDQGDPCRLPRHRARRQAREARHAQVRRQADQARGRSHPRLPDQARAGRLPAATSWTW